LRAQDIPYTAIDHDPEQIEMLRRFSNKVYYGDASRKEILEAAGARTAKYLILAVDDVDSSKEIARVAHEEFPHLKVYARARNRNHVFDLMDVGIKKIRRETFDSSLILTRELLVDLGYPTERAQSILERFVQHDELMMEKQYKVRHDHKLFLDTSRQGMEQLAQVLREDQTQTYIEPKSLNRKSNPEAPSV
jgi:voltage-gated potassium channel Kch